MKHLLTTTNIITLWVITGFMVMFLGGLNIGRNTVHLDQQSTYNICLKAATSHDVDDVKSCHDKQVTTNTNFMCNSTRIIDENNCWLEIQ